ncbi:DUF4255 domain-containing protein [Actinotalea sp. K2]|uniref:DUF4255 domain-containing protein n=1 Tax=Actinotalea sp. K2 TaxID=2939438 RepID=UPI002016BC63|nr:DUF4255 domain-containing protein [Actinotalea sp. K2]MCL3860429.1 DUF4255 domain-containing protein [Actinotalea sp. K2]
MIDDVDAALQVLLAPGASNHGAEVSLEAPTRDWASRRSGPTLDVYLFDIREDLDQRGVAREPVVEDDRTVALRVPPRFFRLAYLITAWTARPDDEHRMLADALAALVVLDSVPAAALTGWLAEQPATVRLEVALPLAEDRSMSDLWTALGGELKPSLEVVVTAPVHASRTIPVLAPPATRLAASAEPLP